MRTFTIFLVAIALQVSFVFAQDKSAHDVAASESEKRIQEKARMDSAVEQSNRVYGVTQKKSTRASSRIATKSKSEATAAPAVDPASREGKLRELNLAYMMDLLTPQQYHEQRARILAETK